MINFPVDIDKTLWSFLIESTGEFDTTNRKWPRLDGGEIPGLDADLIPLLHVEGTKPVFDESTHELESSQVKDIEANELRTEYTIISRPQSELNEIARQSERDAMRAQWELLPSRIRGPYHALLTAANELLDKGDDDAALELIDAAEATVKIKGNGQFKTEFDAVKAGFIASITAMTPAV